MARETKTPPPLPTKRAKIDLGDAIAEEIKDADATLPPLDEGVADRHRPSTFAAPPPEAHDVSTETRMVRYSRDAIRATQLGMPMARASQICELDESLHAYVLLSDGETSRSISIVKPLTIIGRVKEVADIVITDDDVSRHHAAIVYTKEGFYLEDLESTNGTFVGDERVARVKLASGDKIRVGRHTLRFVF